MFTNTLKTPVIEQFERRVEYNSYLNSQFKAKDDDWIRYYNNWLGRFPVLLAYSNVRFQGDDSYKKYSILGNEEFNKYLYGEKKYDFTSHYQVTDQFGVEPHPVLKNFEIKGRGTHGTLREVQLTINCFNYDQIFEIKKYFSVPSMTVFIQYGYATSNQQLKKTIFNPILDDIQQGTVRSYLNDEILKERYKNVVNMEYVKASVYGFQLDQQGMNFTLTVSLLTLNTSQITNIIMAKDVFVNNRYSTAETKTERSITINKDVYNYVNSYSKFMKNNIKHYNMQKSKLRKLQKNTNWIELTQKIQYKLIPKFSGIHDLVIARKKGYWGFGFRSLFVGDDIYSDDRDDKVFKDKWVKDKKQWMVYVNDNPRVRIQQYLLDQFNASNQRIKNPAEGNPPYWYNVMQAKYNVSENKQSNKKKKDDGVQDLKYVTLNWLIGNLIQTMWNSQVKINKKGINFTIKPQFKYLAKYITNNDDVLIFNSEIHNVLNNNVKKVNFNYNQIQQFYKCFNGFEVEGDGLEYNRKNAISTYDKYFKQFENNSLDFYWFGNIYINLDTIITNLENNQNITLDGILSMLFNIISSSTNGKLNLIYTYNEIEEIYQIEQIELNHINFDDKQQMDTYYIKNWGPDSIVKEMVYNITIPDGYKVSMMQVYTDKGNHNILDAMFGVDKGKKIYDISKKIFAQGVVQSPTLKPKQIINWNEKKQIISKDCYIKKMMNTKDMIYVGENFEKHSDMYNDWNEKEYQLAIGQIKIKSNYKHNPIPSGFYITVSMTFDFIANIHWGQVFKLKFNPLGWETKFFVKEVQQRVDQDRSQTTITGAMIG